MGGSKSADHIDNLMAVCRLCHIKYGDLKQYKEFLFEIHKAKIESHDIINGNQNREKIVKHGKRTEP
jgi:hypothetical protein